MEISAELAGQAGTSSTSSCSAQADTPTVLHEANFGECGCIVEQLLRDSFSSLSFEEKSDVIEKGRPTPLLNLESKTKSFTRRFHDRNYEVAPWLCGCKKIKKLFCWPCLLFSKEKNIWTTQGFDDLNNLHKAEKRHILSRTHLISLKEMKQFGKGNRIEFSLSEQYRLSVKKHNDMVKKNRNVVSHLIKAVCFLARQELAFRGHDESVTSINRGNYIELVEEFSDFDSDLKSHLENSTVFSGLSSDIQNDLIYSLSELMTTKIKKELSETPFVALILDETTDITVKSQLSSILRYVANDGNVQERFIHFSDVSSDRTASALYNHAIKLLEDHNCSHKLVAQTYDGAAVLSGEHNGLQARLREKCEHALFVHCYAHKLNLVLSQAASFIKECKIFFSSLTAFSNFFRKSTKRTEALNAEVKKKFPSLPSTRWRYNSRLVSTMYEHKTEIENLLINITDNAEKWDSETICSANGLLAHLRSFDFNLFLTIFSTIFPHSDTLFEILQTKMYDIGFCLKKVENFKKFVENMRNKFETIWSKINAECSDEPPTKRLRISSIPGEDRKEAYRRIFIEIVDVITANISERFSETYKLSFISLLEKRYFPEYTNNFLEAAFSCLKEVYGKFFEFPRLRSELNVIYSDKDMHKNSVAELLRYLKSSELDDVFPETYKLSQLIVTIPATSASAERSFSCLKRIKTYLRNTQGQERLSSLAMLSIEKGLLNKLRMATSFYDDVIDIFAKKNRRIELLYKK